jgi:hypothetical protein
MISEQQQRGHMCQKCKTPESAACLKYSQCSVCKGARYCLIVKACQTSDWPFHKVFSRSMLIILSDCGKWKANRDRDGNPRLTQTRKFNKWRGWRGDNFSHISSLVVSLMQPISRLRMETHFAVIRLRELPDRFQVLSAKTLFR